MELLVRLLADGTLVVILLLGVGALLLVPMRHKYERYSYAVMAGLTSLFAAKLTSIWFQPNEVRPFVENGVKAGAAFVNNPGFPSDHALLATVVVCAVWALTPYRKLAVVLGVATVIMSIARVVAQVHTPLDVIGGIAFGLLGAAWYVDRHRGRNVTT